HAPLAGAAEALHALGRIGRESDAGLLAVVADVDARLELSRDHVAHGGLGLAGERGAVDRLAVVLTHQQIPDGGGSGKAADLRREDPTFAALHGVLLWRGLYHRALC